MSTRQFLFLKDRIVVLVFVHTLKRRYEDRRGADASEMNGGIQLQHGMFIQAKSQSYVTIKAGFICAASCMADVEALWYR